MPALAQDSAATPMAALRSRVRAASPGIASARAALELARARRLAAGHLPAATLSGEVEEVPSGANVADAGSLRLDISRELVPRQRRRAERTLADIEIDRATVELAIAERLVDAAVYRLVVRSAGNAAVASRLASEDSVLFGAEEAVRARFAVADARYIDVLRLRTERLRVETERRRSLTEYHIARSQLVRLAAAADTTALSNLVDAAIATEAPLIAGSLPALPPADSLYDIAGVRQLLAADVRRAEGALALARAEARPAFVPSLGVQRFSDGDAGSAIGLTAGFSLSLPFTAAAANRKRVAAAAQELRLAQVQRTTRQATIDASLAVARDRYEAARSQLAAFDSALLRGAREEREAALAAYRTGDLTLVELLDFERALAQAEVSQIRSRIEAAEALVDYLTAALAAPERGGAR